MEKPNDLRLVSLSIVLRTSRGIESSESPPFLEGSLNSRPQQRTKGQGSEYGVEALIRSILLIPKLYKLHQTRDGIQVLNHRRLQDRQPQGPEAEPEARSTQELPQEPPTPLLGTPRHHDGTVSLLAKACLIWGSVRSAVWKLRPQKTHKVCRD